MFIRSLTCSAPWLISALLCLSSCTSTIGGPGSGDSNPAAGGSSSGSGAGGNETGGSQTGGTGNGGTAGTGGDPYAVPSSPPPTVLVPTSRLARLSRQQWSNTVRDLLKHTRRTSS